MSERSSFSEAFRKSMPRAGLPGRRDLPGFGSPTGVNKVRTPEAFFREGFIPKPGRPDGWFKPAKSTFSEAFRGQAPKPSASKTTGSNVVASPVRPVEYSSQPAFVPTEIKRQLDRLILDRQRALDIAIGNERDGAGLASDEYNSTMRQLARWANTANRDARVDLGGRGLALSPASMRRAAERIAVQEEAQREAAQKEKNRQIAELRAAVQIAQERRNDASQNKTDTEASYRGSGQRNMGSY